MVPSLLGCSLTQPMAAACSRVATWRCGVILHHGSCLALPTQAAVRHLCIIRGGDGARPVSIPCGMVPFPSAPTTKVAARPMVDDGVTCNASASTHAITDTPADSATRSVPHTVSHASSSVATVAYALPHWPVDEIEFNARLPDGGHTQRRMHCSNNPTTPYHGNTHTDGPVLNTMPGRDEPHAPANHHHESTPQGNVFSASVRDNHRALYELAAVPLTAPQQAAVRRVESTKEGVFATVRGGWVCGHCLHPMPHRNRTICDRCHTLRHDLSATEQHTSSPRRDRRNWMCGNCAEFNYAHNTACRCCHTARAECDEVQVMVHERVADEVQAASLGGVVNTRNRVVRWRCGGCAEVNSLQANGCRRCGRERFALTIACNRCAAARQLSNAMVYAGCESGSPATPDDAGQPAHDAPISCVHGEKKSARPAVHRAGSHREGDALGMTCTDSADAHHTPRDAYTPSTFHLLNCFAPYAPMQMCHHCGAHLHGCQVTSFTRFIWWCACGVTNLDNRRSCVRCRLPRSIPSASVANDLLLRQRWDFRYCTMWLCENCDEVNVASRHVVVLDSKDRTDADMNDDCKYSNDRPATRGNNHAQPRKVARLVPGHAHCRRCHSPWHYQVIRDGECWRCACHMVNPREAMSCRVCGMPALPGVQVSAISLWTKGDWYCRKCGRQNYRERVRCRCGVDRSTMMLA